jgi:hypothetical protein
VHALGLLGFEAVVGVVVVTIIITIGARGGFAETISAAVAVDLAGFLKD